MQPQHSLLNDCWIWGYSTAEAQSVAAHELVHAIGLAHNGPFSCGSDPLMDPYTSTRWGNCGINTPRSDDISGVNSFY